MQKSRLLQGALSLCMTHGSSSSAHKQLQAALRLEKMIRTYIFSHLREGHVTMWTASSNPYLVKTEELLEKEKVPY